MKKIIILGLLCECLIASSQEVFMKNSFKCEIGYHDFLYDYHSGPDFTINYSRFFTKKLYLNTSASIGASNKFDYSDNRFLGGIRARLFDITGNYCLFEYNKIIIESGLGFFIDNYEWLYTDLATNEKTVMENMLSTKDFDTESYVGLGITASLGLKIKIIKHLGLGLRGVFGADDNESQFLAARIGLAYDF